MDIDIQKNGGDERIVDAGCATIHLNGLAISVSPNGIEITVVVGNSTKTLWLDVEELKVLVKGR